MMSFTLPHLSKRVWLPLFCVTQKVNFRILKYSWPLGLASFQNVYSSHKKQLCGRKSSCGFRATRKSTIFYEHFFMKYSFRIKIIIFSNSVPVEKYESGWLCLRKNIKSHIKIWNAALNFTFTSNQDQIHCMIFWWKVTFKLW